MRATGFAIVIAIAIACAAGCGKHGMVSVMSGPAHAFGSLDDTGVEVRAFAGSDAPGDHLVPNVTGVSVRQVGDARELAFAMGWQVASGDRRDMGGYLRLTANLIEWDTTMGDGRLGAGGPVLELGFSPGGTGVCVSIAAGWDVRLEHPDHAFVGGFVGLCGM